MKATSLLASAAAFALAIAADHPTRLVYQFENNTWIENLAVRKDGTLLLTSLSQAKGVQGLFTIDPTEKNPQPKLVSDDFGGRTATLGITETTPDTFYLIANNFVRDNAIYSVIFEAGNPKPAINLVTTLDEASLLNGLTKLNDHTLLAADSFQGVVWQIDTTTGAHHVSINDTLMAPAAAKSVGVNGVRFRPEDNHLYFTNSAQDAYAKIRLDATGKPQGAAKKIASLKPEKGVKLQPDDFALDHEGNAYVATMYGNSIQKITPHGHVEKVAGSLNSTTIAVPASAQFGRTAKDSNVLYVTTTGGTGHPVYTENGPVVFGAQIVAIEDVCDF